MASLSRILLSSTLLLVFSNYLILESHGATPRTPIELKKPFATATLKIHREMLPKVQINGAPVGVTKAQLQKKKQLFALVTLRMAQSPGLLSYSIEGRPENMVIRKNRTYQISYYGADHEETDEGETSEASIKKLKALNLELKDERAKLVTVKDQEKRKKDEIASLKRELRDGELNVKNLQNRLDTAITKGKKKKIPDLVRKTDEARAKVEKLKQKIALLEHKLKELGIQVRDHKHRISELESKRREIITQLETIV